MTKDLSETLRRIEKARQTQDNTLDLGDLALAELPAELRDLPHLHSLYLGQIKSFNGREELFDIERAPAPLMDLTPLSCLASLQNLNLRGTGVKDLLPLADLAHLLNVDLCETDVTDLSPLSNLRDLQHLDLRYTGVTHLSPLSGLVLLCHKL